jgi:hypothetical protein
LIQDQETLRELVQRLYPTESFQVITRPECITVEDVAEALDLDPKFVAAELDAIMREREVHRLRSSILEAEKPTFSVERPGHVVDEHPLMRLQAMRQLADENVARHPIPRRVVKKVEPVDLVSKWIAALILGSLLVGFVLVIIYAVANK